MTDDRPVLGCVRVDEAGVVASGSVKRGCEACGAQVWVARSGLDFIEEKNARPTCIPCVREALADSKEKPNYGGLLPGQADEIVREMLHRRRN